MVAILVYILCATTSAACSFLLLRHYKRSRSRLLLWSGISFICFALSNALLFVDLILLPNVDLSLWRNLATLAGLGILLYGLISEMT
jgi:hypothetical protein